MSVIAPALRRRWIHVVACAGALAIAVAAGALVLTHDRPGRPAPSDRAQSAGAVAVPHAEWNVTSFPAGVRRQPGGRMRQRVTRAEEAITRSLDEIYGALLLDRAALPSVLDERFTPRAARRFIGSEAGLPAAAGDVRMTRRRAVIGVEGVRARRAAVTVRVVATGMLDDRRVRLDHRATLWLERSPRWRVVAFDIRQRPIR